MNFANDITFTVLYQKFMFGFLGLEQENTPLFWVMLLLGAVTLGGFLIFQGEVAIVLVILYLIGLFALTLLRIDYSLYLLLFGVMIFDQYDIPGFETITKDVGFFSNLKEISYIPFFDAGVINPIEIHLIFLLFSLLVRGTVLKGFSFKAIPVLIPFLLFAVSFVFSFLYGMRGGGDFLVALWEVRALFYLMIMYLIVPQIIQSKEQIQWLVWTFIVGITFKSFQGIGRFIDLGFTTGGYSVLTNHEDPVFIVTLMILLFGYLVFKTGSKQKIWLLVFLIPFLLAFYVAQRRAAYASFMVSFSTFVLLLPVLIRWKFLKVIFPVFVSLIIYGAVFWNSNSTIARPVQMIKSGIEKPSIETNMDDYYSNLYREIENYNLATTVRHNSVIGIGFGKRYEQPLPLVDIPYPLRDYIPHNQIFWIFVKMGAVGFFAFWFFFNSVAAKGVQIFSQLDDPYLKAVTLFIVTAIINQMVVSFFDLQLTYYRNMIYLGCLIGLLPVIEGIILNKLNTRSPQPDIENRPETEDNREEF